MDINKAMQNIFTQMEENSRLPTGSENSSPRTSLTEQQFDGYLLRLWVVMSETYGHKWTSPMGEVPNDTWKSKLRSLSAEDWIRGITKLNASNEEWPPSLPEFNRWCTGSMSESEAKQAAIAEWDARPPAKYNPNVAPPSYEQLETQRRNFIQSRVAESYQQEKNQSMGIANQAIDPLRICPDEEYR